MKDRITMSQEDYLTMLQEHKDLQDENERLKAVVEAAKNLEPAMEQVGKFLPRHPVVLPLLQCTMNIKDALAKVVC